MEHIKLNLPRKKETKANSEWSWWVGEFTDRINQEREGTKYKPISPQRVAMYLRPYKNDLYYFWDLCERWARRKNSSFSQCFFHYAKPNVKPKKL